VVYCLVEELLQELSKSQELRVAITGPLKDSATVALPTFLCGAFLGPVGAVLGNPSSSSMIPL